MKLEGARAVEALNGPDGMRDSIIRSVQIADDDDLAVVRIRLEAKPNSRFSAFELTLRDIVEFGFYDSGRLGGHHVAFQKCFAVGEDQFYISLDPYDEHVPAPVEEDNYFVQAKLIEAVLTQR